MRHVVLLAVMATVPLACCPSCSSVPKRPLQASLSDSRSLVAQADVEPDSKPPDTDCCNAC